MLTTAVKAMGRKRPAKKKADRKPGSVPHQTISMPTTERLDRRFVFRTWTRDGKCIDVPLGNGFTVTAVGVDSGGRVNERAYRNSIERPIDVLRAAGILRPRQGDIVTVENRRYAAGVELYKIYYEARIDSNVTAIYDKCAGIIMPGQFHEEKSDHAWDQHSRFNRIHRALHPYQHIIENICCKGEGYESRLKERLLAGLDLLADILFGRIDYRSRPITGGPADDILEG
jgi:hypothetical protein